MMVPRRDAMSLLAGCAFFLLSLSNVALVTSFSVGRQPNRNNLAPARRFATVPSQETPLTTTTIATTTAAPTPSWDSLTEILQQQQQSKDEPSEPLVTLYRDTNGWCPFCERVWVALRAKNITYRESLVNLQNKPQWYKDLVPTTLVPAVLFHNQPTRSDGETTKDDKPQPTNERRLVWESMDILRALDEEFPNHGPPLVVQDSPEFDVALASANDLVGAGFRFQFAARNETNDDAAVQKLRDAFETQLNQLDAALETAANSSNKDKAFFAGGTHFTAVDACLLPALERWRYQLPLTLEMDILEGRAQLQAYLDSLMQRYAPYAHRVAGDEYSWTAVASTFLRFFSGNETNAQVASAMERADAAAETLRHSFADPSSSVLPVLENQVVFCQEAATKLISNHEAVVQDCTNPDPKSQTDLPRASNVEVADAVLRHVASLLLAGDDDDDDILERAQTVPLPELLNNDSAAAAVEAALAARTVASRLCVPRDMSGPAAQTLRAVLAITANRLEAEKQ